MVPQPLGESSLNTPLERPQPAALPDLADPHLRTDHLDGNLKSRAVQGGLASFAGHGLKFLLQAVSTVVLARLLEPRDFGLVAMVMAVVGILSLFEDGGLSLATVQSAKVDRRQISTLFWVNAALGLALAALTAALSPALAYLYGAPEVLAITLAFSFTFLPGGLSVQHQAILRRQMRFKALALLDVMAMAIGISLGIAAASLGAGYWSLVLLHVSMPLTRMIGLWTLCNWRPGLHLSLGGVGPMLAFGWNLAGTNVLTYTRRHVDQALIGAVWGAGPVGLYSKAYQLVILPIRLITTPLSGVVHSTLSRLQGEPERFRRYYKKCMEPVLLLGMPISCLLVLAAPEIIAVFLGPKWMETVPIFRALAPAAFIGTFNVAGGWVLLPLGRASRLFRINLLTTVVIVSAISIGLPFGPMGVAVALSTAYAGWRFPQLVLTLRGSPVTLHDLWTTIRRPAAASLTATLVLLPLRLLNRSSGVPLLDLVLQGLLFSGVYLGALAVLPGGRESLRSFLQFAGEARGRLGKRPPPPPPAREAAPAALSMPVAGNAGPSGLEATHGGESIPRPPLATGAKPLIGEQGDA